MLLAFPSRGPACRDSKQRRKGPPPPRHVVKVVGLDGAVGEKEQPLFDLARRVAVTLFVPPNGAHRAAELVGKPLLAPSVLLSPRRQLHRFNAPSRLLPEWLSQSLALWQYANMAKGQIVYIRRVANDDDAPNRINELLRLRGMTQADLARAANVSVSALNKVIKGTRGFDQEWMRRLSPHLGVSPAELLPIEDNPLILDDAERDLINRYRTADQSTRAQLERVTEALMPFGQRPADAA